MLKGKLALVAAIAATALGGCGDSKTTTIDQGNLQTAIAVSIAQQKHELSIVQCPKGVTARKGAVFTCTATLASGRQIPFTVTATDSKGNVHYGGFPVNAATGAGPSTERTLEAAFITNWADGGVGRARRWQRDAELLEQALEREPENARDRFYLAQTYRDLGQTERAIESYRQRRRSAAGTRRSSTRCTRWAYFSAKLGNWTQAVPALLEAWNYRPARIEPLYHLALGYREREAHEAGHLFVLRRWTGPYLPTSSSFEPWIYRWGALFEYSIAAYYVGDPAAALTACDRLLRMNGLPTAYREQTRRNREFCRAAVKRPTPPSFSIGERAVRVRPRPEMSDAP